MFCEECGKEVSGDSEFCVYCGKALSPPVTVAGQEGQPPAPPGSPAAATPPQPGGVVPPATIAGPPAGPPVQPGPKAGPPGKSPLPWILGGVGLAVVIAVVLVLVFVVFGGGADTSSAEKVVETFLEAMEKQDVDMLFGTMEPSYASELKDALGSGYKKLFEEYFFAAFPENLKITVKKMDTKIDGDKAVVKVVDGTMTYTDEDGKEVTEEASEADIETTDLVKVDGKWYISSDMWQEAGMDPDMLEDLADMEEDEETTTEESDTTPTKEELNALVYPGAKIDELMSSAGETAYLTNDPVDKVIAWYKDKLSGESNLTQTIEESTAMFIFGPTDKQTFVMVFPGVDGTSILISSI